MSPMTDQVLNKIRPIRDRILVKPYPADEVSSGGIIVPDTAKEDSSKMLVVAVGSGTYKEKMQFSPGETVFRVKDDGDEILINGEKYFIVKQSHVLAKLN